jgi:hypothetical protein
MTNVVRWFEDFPRRALELLPEMKTLADKRDRLGSLSLLIAPALIVAPYERLQTYARRRNPQCDYLHFPEAHNRFNAVMETQFSEADFWTARGQTPTAEWRASQIPRITPDPSSWKTEEGFEPSGDGFWFVDIGAKETRWVWRFLRDALAHWNVASSDGKHETFDEKGVMQRLLFYRAYDDDGPWDVVSVSPEGFFRFLKD